MAKYVILLYFYIKVEQNYQQKKNTKNIKIQDQIRLKTWDFKSHVSNLNFSQISNSKVLTFKL